MKPFPSLVKAVLAKRRWHAKTINSAKAVRYRTVRSLWASGNSAQAIAAQLGLPLRAVRSLIRKSVAADQSTARKLRRSA